MVPLCAQSSGDLGSFLQRGAVFWVPKGSYGNGLCAAGSTRSRKTGLWCSTGIFMISTYQFYRNDWGKLKKGKWQQRRVKSLLVPNIVWNFLYYLSYVIASRIPAVGGYGWERCGGITPCGHGGCQRWPTPTMYSEYRNTSFGWWCWRAGALSALKAEWSGTSYFWRFLDSGAGKSGQFPVNPDALVIMEAGHDCASSLPGKGGGRERGDGSVLQWDFESCGSAVIYYIGLWRAPPHPLSCAGYAR